MSLARDPDFYRLLSGSYARLVGRAFPADPISGEATPADRLYSQAQFCVLAHSRQADPVFIYANQAAQACFEYDWDEITCIPSRLSAQAPDQAERQRLLDEVKRNGFIDNYRGLRIAKSGRRFWIEQATVWQLIDAAGICHGQAAMFTEWSPEG